MSQYCRPEAVVVGWPVTFMGAVTRVALGVLGLSLLLPQPDAIARAANNARIIENR